jgi:hypothetical protein
MNRVFVEMSSELSEDGVEATRPSLDGRPSISRESAPVIGRADFVLNKRATGRPKDLADLALLSDASNEG